MTKNNKIFWLVFSLIFLSISVIITYYGMFGHWLTSICGVEHAHIWDPDGAYIGSGITFFDQRYPSFVGHPGLTLMFLIQIVTRLYYWLAFLLGTKVPYEVFMAKNIYYVIFLSKITLTLMHLLSFYVLYLVSLKFLERKDMSLIVVLSYATTYPILMYINKVSPEPVMVLFTLLSIYWIWKYFECIEKKETVKSYAYMALVSFAAVSAFYTKINIVAPLVLFIAVYIFFKRDENQNIKFNSKQRFKSFLLYLIFSFIFLIIGGYKLDWKNFFQFWFQYAPGTPEFSNSRHWLTNLVEKVNYFKLFDGLTTLSYFKSWFSIQDRRGLFTISEFLFIVFSIAGLILFWKTQIDKRAKLIWVGIFLLMIAPLVLYKSFWHYFVIHLAFLSIFFAYFIYTLIDRILKNRANQFQKFLIAVLTTLIIHSISIYMFICKNEYDMQEYKKWSPYYHALNRIGYNECIGVNINYRGFSGDIVGRSSSYVSLDSVFFKTYTNFFVTIDRGTTISELEKKNVRIIVEQNTPNEIVTKFVDKSLNANSDGFIIKTDEETKIKDRIIGTAFKKIIRMYVATIDINKFKKDKIEQINKMDKEEYGSKYLRIYGILRYSRPAVADYGFMEKMNKNQLIVVIKKLEKKDIILLTDAVPDWVIADTFRQFMASRGAEIPNGSIFTKIDYVWKEIKKKI